jgi:hypothetical protein
LDPRRNLVPGDRTDRAADGNHDASTQCASSRSLSASGPQRVEEHAPETPSAPHIVAGSKRLARSSRSAPPSSNDGRASTRFVALTARRRSGPPDGIVPLVPSSRLAFLGNFRRADPSERKPVGVICPGETAEAVKGELQTLWRTSLPSDRIGLKRIDCGRRSARIGAFDGAGYSSVTQPRLALFHCSNVPRKRGARGLYGGIRQTARRRAHSASEMSTSIWFRSASVVMTSPLRSSAIGPPYCACG